MFVLGLSIAHTAAALGTLLRACLCVRQSQLLVLTAGNCFVKPNGCSTIVVNNHNPITKVPKSWSVGHAIFEALAVQNYQSDPRVF